MAGGTLELRDYGLTIPFKAGWRSIGLEIKSLGRPCINTKPLSLYKQKTGRGRKRHSQDLRRGIAWNGAR